MLAYFPTLYEDELLYSGIARYHVVSGNKTQKQTIEDLFGSRMGCATADLPSNLTSLAGILKGQYTTDQIISDHTLLPYYAHYVNQKKFHHVLSLMGNGSKQGEVHASLGLLASSIKLPEKLRFCTECYKADSEIFEPYWHRCHQLPGVSICPLHKSILKISEVEYSTLHHKFSYLPLAVHSKLIFTEPLIDASWLEHLEYIAVQSNILLQSQLKSREETTCYKRGLSIEKYQSVGGRIRFNRLIQDFRNFYTDELLNYLDCSIDSNSSDTWLHKIIRNQEEITHPLRHLLLLGFFEKFFGGYSISSNNQPFGSGPWPCLNHAADHCNLSVVEKCVVSRCSTTSKPVGTFQCSCGFVYSRRGPDTCDEDRYRRGRIRTFGPVWYNKLKHLNETNSSLRQKARILGVDPGTVKNQTEYLDCNKASLHQIEKQSQPVTSRRKRSRVRNSSGVKIKPRVDWSQRDEILYDAIVKSVEQMKQLPHPQRITLASIARYTDSVNLSHKLLHNLNKLPRTKEFIKKQIDSTETFQVRRLIWAASKLKETEGRVVDWRLLKLAGLNQPLKKMTEDKFLELLEGP
ncbi:TnsD family transposase [Paenibacillus sp. J5C_2022]|uniref:TnsD family Tn7-like transposition protein n=1 Tax=Paenibacillus sp. J5C2022 TaxID=2977129 RepID=UPI0021CECDF4|nr:TnsD family Tn7-like transposition protein [Paenibacillus sp. J5C2022]MCU6709735.1 TnsD family transposase [Paenibacillus sp. J5C2022]